MTVIFGGEVYTVWLRLVTFQVVIFQQWAPHLDNLKTTIKTAETTRYKLCKLWWLWITSDNGERQTRVTGENRSYHGKGTSRPLSPSRLPLRAHFHRGRETSGYEAELSLYNITANLKSHESVTPTLRSRRLMAWGQLSMQLVPRHHSTKACWCSSRIV